MTYDSNTLLLVKRIKETSDAIKKAQWMELLRTEKVLYLREIADLIGVKLSHVAHYLRLLKLPEIVIDGYYSNLISQTHLFIIARLKTDEDMLKAYEYVLANNASIDQTEIYVREQLYGIKTVGKPQSQEEVKQFEQELQRIYGDVHVKLTQSRIKSKLIIEMKGNLEVTDKTIRSIQKRILKKDNELT